MHVTIKGHKTTSDAELCKSCQHAQSLSGRSINEQTVFCVNMERFVPFPVTECSKYLQVGIPTRYDMERMAWKVAVDKKTRRIGFYSPKDYHTLSDSGKLIPHYDDDE